MLHYGDITKISGYDVPIVDCVTFGAPCQDLSVAGKREGMKHKSLGDDETTRSGLFHEAIRIIKEMRENDARNGRSARYKALGNSIALPPWKWVIKRLCSHYERDATLASLFDGIGGFPCLWEQINGKGSCLWASEIEDFPIAVTKARIE